MNYLEGQITFTFRKAFKHDSPVSKGFTLVEALLYTALLSLLLIVLTEIFVAILNVRSETQTKTSTESEGRFIMSRLAYDIARASSVTTPASIGMSGSTLALVIGGQTYTYSLQSGNLQLVSPAGTDTLNSNATSLTALTFLRTGNSGGKPLVTQTFTIQSVGLLQGNKDSKTFTTTVSLR